MPQASNQNWHRNQDLQQQLIKEFTNLESASTELTNRVENLAQEKMHCEGTIVGDTVMDVELF